MRQLLARIAGPSEEFRLGLRVFHVYCLVAGLVLVIAAPFNYLSGLHPATVWIGAIVGPVYFLFFYLSRFRGLGESLVWLFLVSGFVLVTALWLTSGGLEGSTPLVCVLLTVIAMLVLDTVPARISGGLVLMFVALLSLVDSWKPEWILAYPSRDARMADLRFGLLATLMVVAILIAVLRRTYRAEQEKVVQQNRRLEAQTADLIDSRNEAERALKTRSEFLSVVSHELRTPLNSVVGITELLRTENPRPEQLEYLKILSFSASNLLSLVNDVLDYARLESGRVELERAPFDLTGLLISVTGVFRERAEAKSLRFEFTASDLPAVVRGDSGRLLQILNNLLGNAVKFTYAGTVRLDVTPDGPDILFVVTDTGIGIPQDRITHIFEKFTQAGPQVAREFGGTGLGLAITERLVRLYGGSITVESSPGQGTRFSLRLSLPADQAQMEKRGSREIPAGLRVLLAEDYEPNVLLARRLLEKRGISVTVTVNGAEALEACRHAQFDLLLLDIHMPEMDGLQAVRSIRALGGWCTTVPVFALTAAALPEEKSTALAAGFDEYLSKPFAPADLFEKIAHYCGR